MRRGSDTTVTWQPPPPWQSVIDQNSGRPFYHNPTTGETTWTPPGELGGVTMDGVKEGDQPKIPQPDPVREPEKYEAWKNLMGHLEAGGGGGKGDGLCGDFQRGVCNRGAMCKFSHGEGNPTRWGQAQAYGGVPGDGMCNDFLRGVCTRGDRCKFSHGDTPKGPPTGQWAQPRYGGPPAAGGYAQRPAGASGPSTSPRAQAAQRPNFLLSRRPPRSQQRA